MLLTLAALAFWSGPTAAAVDETPAGRAVFVKGKVTATTLQGIERILRRGAKVFQGDTVAAGVDGQARLVMADRSMFSLKPNGALNIKSFSFDKNAPEKDSMAVDLLKGGMRALTGAIGKRDPDNVKLATPVATIGIRGTAVEIDLSKAALEVSFDFGQGYIDNRSGRQDVGELDSYRVPGADCRPSDSDEARDPSGEKDVGELDRDRDPRPDCRPSAFKKVRGPWDAAVVARRLAGMSPDQLVEQGAALSKNMGLASRVLLTGMLEQAPGLNTAAKLSIVEGLVGSDRRSAPTMLYAATSIARERAPQLVQRASRAGVKPAVALESVLFAMPNPSPTEVKAVAAEAVKAGISKQDAQKVLRNIQESACQ